MMRAFFRFFSSLRLTVVLLGFSLALVFFGTLDQVHYGIHETQRRYFESFVAVWSPAGPYSDSPWRFLRIPLPGGYLLGGLLLVNLLVAQFHRFRFRWTKTGILLIHGGLVLLIVSEFLTDILAEERQMWIDEGGTRNWAETYLENELVVIDKSDPELDTVYAVDARRLRRADPVDHPDLPFTLASEAFYPNSSVRPVGPQEGIPLRANAGLAGERRLMATPKPVSYAENTINTVTALVRIRDRATGADLGTWMLSNLFDERFPPQRFSAGGREWEVAVRFKRTYYPFSVTLEDFTHDRYPGTEIPRNFASDVIVTRADSSAEREARIFMNNPLRHEGYTFYQSSFANQDTTSALQVVRNPGWTLPYLAVTLVGLGLCVQFGMGLSTFATRRSRRSPQ